MTTFAALEQHLHLLATVLTGVMVVRLVQLRLVSILPLFVLLISTALARSLIFLVVPMNRYWYGIYFMASEGLLFVLYMLATLEVFTHVFQQYKGIQTLSKQVTAGAILTATAIAAASLYPDVMAKAAMTPLDVFLVAERGVLFGLAVLILLLGCFLLWFPISLPRNVVVHSAVFSVYFLTKASALLVRNLGKTTTARMSSVAILVISNICVLLWIALLRRAEQKETLQVGNRWSRAREQELVGQLEAINSALARTGRK